MIKVLKKLATNKKGSEIVEKIFMVVAAIAITFIVNKIIEAKGTEVNVDGTISTAAQV